MSKYELDSSGLGRVQWRALFNMAMNLQIL